MFEPVFKDGQCMSAVSLTLGGTVELVEFGNGGPDDEKFEKDFISEGPNWRIPDFRASIDLVDIIHNKVLEEFCGTPEEATADLADITLGRCLEKCARKVRKCLTDHVYLKDDRQYDVLVTFVIHSYFIDLMPMAPPVLVSGPHGSGKSSLLNILSRLVYRPHWDTNYSAAGMTYYINRFHCTLLLDEADENLSADRGREINSVIKAASEKNRPRTRVSEVNGDWIARSSELYTDVVSCTLGGYMRDTMSRAIRIAMPILNKGDCTDLDIKTAKSAEQERDISEAVGMLYALRTVRFREILTGRCGSPDSNRVDFTKAEIRCGEDLSSGAYSEILGLPYRGPCTDRSKKVVLSYYVLSGYTGRAREVVGYIVEQEDLKRKGDTTSVFGVCVRAMCDVVLGRPGGEGVPCDPPGDGMSVSEFMERCRKVRLRDIRARMEAIVRDSDDEASGITVTRMTPKQVLDQLGIPTVEREANTRYLDPGNPCFLETFVDSVRRFCPDVLPLLGQVADRQARAEAERTETCGRETDAEGWWDE